jgi:hypothetical protein
VAVARRFSTAEAPRRCRAAMAAAASGSVKVCAIACTRFAAAVSASTAGGAQTA